MSGIWLPSGSLVLAIYLVVLFFTRGNVKNFETNIYKKLIVINLVYSTFGVGIYLFAMLVGHLYLTGVLQSFYLIMMDLMLLFLLKYVIELNKFDKKVHNIFNKVINVITTIVILFILALPMDTIIVGETVDLNGPAYYAAMVEVILYFFAIMSLCTLFAVRFKNERSKLLPFLILFVFFVLGLFLRIYYPEVITETFIFTLSYLVMYNTIENPDVKLLEKMEIAKDQAEKANRAKSDFLSSMSHEIRTPLNAIVGFSEDIQEYKNELPPQVIEDSTYIMEASQTLLEIVGNILDINKIESEKMEITNEVYNPKELIETVATINATRIGDKDINFVQDIADDLPYELFGDKLHFKQILNNLLSNAFKYTEKGEVSLTVKCINTKHYSNILIAVRDTGRGIKGEDIKRLFNKFDRLDIELNTTTEGTGLGLAITKSLVEMMGGKINVDSSFGKGSIFIVQLPQKISSLTKPITVGNVNSNNNVNNESNYGYKKVLIVDDNELNIKVAKRALQDFNFEIDSCNDGLQCLQKIKNGNEYDLILMDIMMPNMSGETALAKLKENVAFEIPTIALTAGAIAGAKEKYLSEGFADYIAKPFSKDQIKQKLDAIFK